MHGGAGSGTLKRSAEFTKMKSPGLRRPGLYGRKAGLAAINDLPSFAEVPGQRIMEGPLPISAARLTTYIDALRNLARSDVPDRVKLIEKNVDLYLAGGAKRSFALEALCSAIHNEESERHEDEDWSVAREYVRSLLQQTKPEGAA